MVSGIERAAGPHNPGGIQTGRVGCCAGEGAEEVRARITNETDIRTELKSVLTLCPRHIIHNVVHWSLENPATGNREFGVVSSLVVVQSSEKDDRSGVVVSDVA